MLDSGRRDKIRLLISVAFGFILLAYQSAHAQGVVLQMPNEDLQMITAQLGPIVGDALPSLPIDDVSRYFPLREHAATFQVTAGRHVGNIQTLALTQVTRPSGNSSWRLDLSPSLSGFIHQTAEGDLMMPTVGDTRDGVMVITTPANPFLIKGIKPGETRFYSQQVIVNALDDPTDQEYSGILDGTYVYLGTYQVTVPAGSFPAAVVRLKCEGKVGPAHTRDTAYYFFAPGKGVIAMISQEDATAFWIIHIDSTAGRVLTAY